MIVVMKAHAEESEIDAVVQRIQRLGFNTHLSRGVERTIIGIVGADHSLNPGNFEVLAGVERAVRVLHPFKIASRDFHPEDSVFEVSGVPVGGDHLTIMAGPCSVESREQLLETAAAVKEAGAHILRGGAYKPRTSPYSFQGLGLRGLEILGEAKERYGLPIVTEVMSPDLVPLVAEYADMLQIGARSMQNYALLQAVGKTNKPILLKRGMMSTMQEWLMAAEYILSNGNDRVALCERGIRTFEPYTRNTLDINAIPAMRTLTHLPIIGDPSHGTGKWELVTPVARAIIAAGANGLIVEVHPRPEEALSDGAQSLKPERFAGLVRQVRAIYDLLQEERHAEE